MFINYLILNLFTNMIYLLVLLIMNLLSVAFLTLYERKILSYIQSRKGPNKVLFLGMFQPFSDVIKLLSKEFFFLKNTNMIIFILMPFFMITLTMMMWMLVPFYINNFILNNSFLLMLLIMGLNIYPMILMGWSSNSNYSLLGSVRSIAQALSYEVILFLILFILILMVENFSFKNFNILQFYSKFFFLLFPVYLIFMISMLIELNRTPFDLVEGESELVSGFNVEYYGSLFSLIFMSEYLSIIVISYLITIFFFGLNLMFFGFYLVVMIHMVIIIWLRGVLPRLRYDEMMMMCWKSFLSVILIYIMFILEIKELILYFFLS